MHYLLFYEYIPDFEARRDEFRRDHLVLAWNSHVRGELILGGVMDSPADGALLFFKGDGPEVAESFAAADPYVMHGLVKRWRVRPWNTVVGETAAMPVRLT